MCARAHDLHIVRARSVLRCCCCVVVGDISGKGTSSWISDVIEPRLSSSSALDPRRWGERGRGRGGRIPPRKLRVREIATSNFAAWLTYNDECGTQRARLQRRDKREQAAGLGNGVNTGCRNRAAIRGCTCTRAGWNTHNEMLHYLEH